MGNTGRLVLVLCLIMVSSVSAYPSDRSFEEALQDAYNGYFSDQDARDLQELFERDEDVDDPYLSDLKQNIISRLLDDQEQYEPIDEIENDQTERGLSDFNTEPLMDEPAKYNFDDSEFSEFDSRFQQMENDFDDANDEEETEFERESFPDDMTVNNFDENMMPDFEENEYMRNANEDWNDANEDWNNDRFSDVNDNDMRGNGYEGIAQVDDFNEDGDFDQEYARANDFDEDEMADLEGQDFERMTNMEDEFANDNDMRGQEGIAEEIDGGDDDPDDEELNDTDREILRELLEEVLKKKIDGEDDLKAEKDLEEKFNGL